MNDASRAPNGPKSDSARPGEGGDLSRIARAGARLLREAERTLAREQSPRKARPRKEAPAPALPGLTDGLDAAERANLVEVCDRAGQTLLCMPLESVLRQKLPFTAVSLALYTRQKRLVIQKRRDTRLDKSGAWDLFTSIMLVGESSEEAAERTSRDMALMGGLSFSRLGTIIDTGRTIMYFAANLPPGLYPSHPEQELLAVDEDELLGLARDMPELVSPSLSFAVRDHLLFHDIM